MIRWAAALALLICCADTAAAATACRSTSGKDDYYQYRLIDGRKCWFRGHTKLEKSALTWKQEIPRGASGTARKAPSVEAVATAVVMTETPRTDRSRPIPLLPDFNAVFAHFPAFDVAHPPLHLLHPRRVSQAYGARAVAIVLYRSPQ